MGKKWMNETCLTCNYCNFLKNVYTHLPQNISKNSSIKVNVFGSKFIPNK